MKNNPLISVIMSVYNAEEYLEKAVKSILEQSYNNLEFVIINDGSKDKSLEILKKYEKIDERIVLIDQENKGLTKSLNIGISYAKGEYIARMDADDISLPERFENFIDYIKKYGDIEIYSTPAWIINENDVNQKVIPNYFRRNGFDQTLLNYYNSMIHGALIVRNDIIKKFKYNEDYRYSQDFELYHRLIKNGYNIKYDKENITYLLRIHSNSISNKQKPEQLKLFKQIFDDNNLKFYEQTILNRIYFKIIDIFYFLKAV